MKIYCTPQRADQVLLDIVQPFLDRHVAVVGRWFFIRYQDPAPHIRLRLQTADAEAAVLQAELQDLLASAGSSGLVRRFVADTYEREIERYGADLITGVEDCFHAGSAWTIGFLQQGGLNRRGGPELLPFVLVYRMCTTLLPDREKLGLFLNRIKNNFLTEFKGNERLHIDFDNRYRELAGPLRALIERGATPVTGSEAEGGVLESLNRLVSGAVKFPDSRCEKLLADLVHLQVNRVFANRQRQHEALVWYCLYKYETSLAARSRATAAR
jgi:thiopeptide-type bacteriocin biosynthesis protein